MPDAPLIAEQPHPYPVPAAGAVAGAGNLDIVRHPAIQRPHPVAGEQFPDELLPSLIDHLDHPPGGTAPLPAKLLPLRNQLHPDLVAIHRTADELRRDKHILLRMPVRRGRQCDKSESTRSHGQLSDNDLMAFFAAATGTVGNPAETSLLLFFHRHPPSDEFSRQPLYTTCGKVQNEICKKTIPDAYYRKPDDDMVHKRRASGRKEVHP